MKKTVIILVLLSLGAGIGWKVYRVVLEKYSKGKQKKGGPKAVAVEISPITRGLIIDKGKFTGSLEANSRFDIAPKVTGRLEKLFVDLGDKVKPGQAILQIEDEEFRQQVEEAKAQLEVTKAQLGEGESALRISGRDYKRVKELGKKNVSSQAELDTALANYEAAQARLKVSQAQVEQKKAALKASQIRLSYTKISADWKKDDGERVVGARHVHQGSLVSSNTPIITLLDIRKLRGVIQVIEKDYSKIRDGQMARVQTDAYPERVFEGKIVRISPLLQKESRQARVEIEIENKKGLLKPGMFVLVEIEFRSEPQATLIPQSGLASWKGKPGVYLVDLKTKKAHFIPIKRGIVTEKYIEISKPVGLKGSVVTLGQHLLQDGASIFLSPQKKKNGESGKSNAAKGAKKQ